MSVVQDGLNPPTDVLVHHHAEDIHQLFVVFAENRLHYQEIKLEESLTSICQQWPLLAEIHSAEY